MATTSGAAAHSARQWQSSSGCRTSCSVVLRRGVAPRGRAGSSIYWRRQGCRSAAATSDACWPRQAYTANAAQIHSTYDRRPGLDGGPAPPRPSRHAAAGSASAGSLPGRRAAARWRGWGVAPGGAGRLGTPGRAYQQGVRHWACEQTPARAGGWPGSMVRGGCTRPVEKAFEIPILQ